jgi:hypothetical protein
MYLLVLVLLLFRACAADQIEGCRANKHTIQRANDQVFYKVVQDLRQTQFFRIFKVNLNKECQLWKDISVCYKATCAVKECKKDEIPAVWVEEMNPNSPNCSKNYKQGKLTSPNVGGPVDRTLDVEFDSWFESDDSWIVQDDDSSSKSLQSNLFCLLISVQWLILI